MITRTEMTSGKKVPPGVAPKPSRYGPGQGQDGELPPPPPEMMDQQQQQYNQPGMYNEMKKKKQRKTIKAAKTNVYS